MSRWRKLVYSLATAVLVLGLGEAALRLVGFRYQRVTTYLQFNYPRAGYLEAFFEIDPDLLYRIRPSVRQRWVDLTWQPAFDLKIRDHRTFSGRPAATARIVALGDSSTYGVNTPLPWPARLQALLDRDSAGRFQVLNLGVPGYTVFQGRRVLETRGRRLAPTHVVVCFGWNDHLLALGYTDREQKVGGRGVVVARNLLSASRLYQVLSWSIARARGPPETPGRRRVDPDAFATDLAALVETAHRLGARTLLCTYPTALTWLVETATPPPAWLLETHLTAGGVTDLVRLQERYNETVRRVARETGSELVDLDAAFRREGVGRLFADPAGDMIHPSEDGYDRVARLIYGALAGDRDPPAPGR